MKIEFFAITTASPEPARPWSGSVKPSHHPGMSWLLTPEGQPVREVKTGCIRTISRDECVSMILAWAERATR